MATIKVQLGPPEITSLPLEPIELLPATGSYAGMVEMVEFCDREITKAILGPLHAEAPIVAPSMIQALAHAYYTEAKMKEHWQHFLSAFAMPRPELQKPKRPKWGQRGRHRLRKTRIVARTINHLINVIRGELLCQKPKATLFTMESSHPPMVV